MKNMNVIKSYRRMIIKRYCTWVEKKTVKLLKMLYGYNSMNDALKSLNLYHNVIVGVTRKEPKECEPDDIRKCFRSYEMYKSLHRVIKVYTDALQIENNIVMED